MPKWSCRKDPITFQPGALVCRYAQMARASGLVIISTVLLPIDVYGDFWAISSAAEAFSMFRSLATLGLFIRTLSSVVIPSPGLANRAFFRQPLAQSRSDSSK